MGPAAMNGPKPGIAKAPIPASTPNVPPMTPPAVAPVVAAFRAGLFYVREFFVLQYQEAKPDVRAGKIPLDQRVDRPLSMFTR
jgi:hypothetical protein